MATEEKKKHNKLPKLPKNVKIQKRPLLRPPIPSPYSGRQNPKVVYISSKTPFISAVKRVRTLLHLAEKRDRQSESSTNSNTNTTKQQNKSQNRNVLSSSSLSASVAPSASSASNANPLGLGGLGASGKKGREPEEVLMKATGKAIAKAMNLALFFQGQRDCDVRVRTGTAYAIDDIELLAEKDEGGNRRGEDVEGGDVEDAGRGGDAGENVPESRLRQTSVLEVAVTLR